MREHRYRRKQLWFRLMHQVHRVILLPGNKGLCYPFSKKRRRQAKNETNAKCLKIETFCLCPFFVNRLKVLKNVQEKPACQSTHSIFNSLCTRRHMDFLYDVDKLLPFKSTLWQASFFFFLSLSLQLPISSFCETRDKVDVLTQDSKQFKWCTIRRIERMSLRASWYSSLYPNIC